MPISPNSLTTIAVLAPSGRARRARIKVVLPAPRKPVTAITGRRGPRARRWRRPNGDAPFPANSACGVFPAVKLKLLLRYGSGRSGHAGDGRGRGRSQRGRGGRPLPRAAGRGAGPPFERVIERRHLRIAEQPSDLLQRDALV